ncbi:hypothetical protein BRADI_1g47490v3 [Brachypodium distachyon]|uniref:Uncharacterized protein n=2 Tax=Brachypodium distachyon TaxID=15368 RepID=A0A2K2DQ00_BRADI|nr:hypothetical protein BRADI_1g47490v3 [Brachypodium distachyon]PNT76363.1 hypothetical protein BRADI_1g47490v3 [Brachypodium distachyon]
MLSPFPTRAALSSRTKPWRLLSLSLSLSLSCFCPPDLVHRRRRPPAAAATQAAGGRGFEGRIVWQPAEATQGGQWTRRCWTGQPLLPAAPMAPPSQQLVFAASSTDAGVAAWDLRTGAEAIRHRLCASRPRALAAVAGRFLAAAQASAGKSAPIYYYQWDKPQVAVKSFPTEPIRALIADPEGSYLIGGGVSGDIFFWEVATGELLVRWHAHYLDVRCLALYDLLLVSGSEDGSIKVWDLITMLDELARSEAKTPYLYSFNQHALPVTDIACFHGEIAVSSSEDRTCKIWNLSEGRMLRSISFPAIIDSIVLDPRSHIFYAGGRDGKIYVTAMGVDVTSKDSDDSSILGALDDHSKGVTSLASSTDGLLLVSGSEDGSVRVWDTRTQQVTRKFKHSQGPVTNVLIVAPKRVNLPPLQPRVKFVPQMEKLNHKL